MAAPTRAMFRKVVEIQALVLQKPFSALLRHSVPAVNCGVVRLQSNGGSKQTTGTGKPASAPPPPTPASSATDGSTYQTTEYYGYNDMSFYDLESEMLKFRQTQPDPQKPPPTPAK